MAFCHAFALDTERFFSRPQRSRKLCNAARCGRSKSCARALLSFCESCKRRPLGFFGTSSGSSRTSTPKLQGGGGDYDARDNHRRKSDCRFCSQTRPRIETSRRKLRNGRLSRDAAQARSSACDDLSENAIVELSRLQSWRLRDRLGDA